MPTPPPPEHTKWKKGQCPNPGGRPKGLMTKDQLRVLIQKFMDYTKEELEVLIKSPKTSLQDIMVASTISACIKQGDFGRLDGLWNRLVGKVKEEVEMIQPKPYIIKTLSGDQIELGTALPEQEDET